MKPKRQSKIPEAVASVTYSITSMGGFNALFTVRGETGLGLLATLPTIEKKLADAGYTPQVRKSWGKKEVKTVPDRKCPTCGSGLVYFGKEGKDIKCSKQTYDFQTKQSGGCPFIEWSNETIH